MKKEAKQAQNEVITQMVNEKPKSTALQIIKSGNEPQAVEAKFKQMDEPKKAVLNLEATLKIVEDLFLKKRHRDRLDFTINQLDEFEIKRKSEDLDEKNNFQGCTIKISDDDRREWTTRNPAIIAEVVTFLKSKFLEKIGEIEAQIILPA